VPEVTPPEVVHLDPNAEDFCQGMAQQIAECNKSGWRRADCQQILAKLNNCADPLIAHPIPDGETTCGIPEVDPEEVRKVAVLACQSRIRPAPGEDPCVPQQIEGDMLDYFYRLDSEGKPVPCTDPRAMPGEWQCTGSFTLVEFGTKDLQDLVDHVGEELGTALIVPKPPGPPRPGPE
jgi:hypothetical protein